MSSFAVVPVNSAAECMVSDSCACMFADSMRLPRSILAVLLLL